MKIREMAKGDIAALAKLNCRIFKGTDEALAADVFSGSFRNGIKGACLVAEEDGRIVGAIAAERKSTFYPNAAGIKSFFVLEGYRGKGIGGKLLESCLAALETAGIKSVSLSVDPENKGAISVYDKAGFELFRLKYLKKL